MAARFCLTQGTEIRISRVGIDDCGVGSHTVLNEIKRGGLTK
jgi:hypothetical protein